MLAISVPSVLMLIQLACSLSVETINRTISIQTTDEVYYAYIPLATDCTYNVTSPLQLGRVEYTALDPITIFEAIEVSGQVSFWGALVDGLRMLVNQGELLQNGTYSQVVLFNSSFQNSLTQRQLILVTFTDLAQIVFSYALPAYNYTTNTLAPSLLSQATFLLSIEIERIVRDCKQAGTYVRIAYIGNNTFMGLCPNTTDLFAWTTSNNNTQSYVYTNLSFLAGEKIQNMTSNPAVLFPDAPPNSTLRPPYRQYGWNICLLTQGGTSSYFCAANLSGLVCEGYGEEQNWL